MYNSGMLAALAAMGSMAGPMPSWHMGSARWWTPRSSVRARLYERRRKATAKRKKKLYQ